MIIPHERLDRETLLALIEEFVTRDGALHGHDETPIARKVTAVLDQLKAGRAMVVFDEENESATIVMRESLRGGGGGGGGGAERTD